MTYGQLKFQLTKAYPGVDLDLIEGWIDQRYAEILGELPWSRQEVTAVLQTIAPYSTGTVTISAGSSAIALAGGAFTPAMTGMAFSVTGESDVYGFTYGSEAAGTLDRPYEGALAFAPGAAFTIFQHVYPMPANCRMLEDTAFTNFGFGPLVRMARSQFNRSCPIASPGNAATADTQVDLGIPGIWTSYMDDGSTPPNMQVQLYPAPDKVYGIPFEYVSDPGALSGESTSLILQVWMQPAALVQGVTALIKAHLKDLPGAQFAALLAKSALKTMRGAEAQGMAPAQMQLDSYYTSYRAKRWNR